MAIVCLCKTGIIATCTAKCREDELTCRFQKTASFANRCRHRIEERSNHCDNVEAQKFTRGVFEIEEEEELDIEEFLDEDPMDALERITSCATCDKIDSGYSADCQLWNHLEPVELRDLARRCVGFDLTASCIICQHHDDCHIDSDGNQSTHNFVDKVNIAQTCKKYNPTTNKGPADDDDIPF